MAEDPIFFSLVLLPSPRLLAYFTAQREASVDSGFEIDWEIRDEPSLINIGALASLLGTTGSLMIKGAFERKGGMIIYRLQWWNIIVLLRYFNSHYERIKTAIAL